MAATNLNPALWNQQSIGSLTSMYAPAWSPQPSQPGASTFAPSYGGSGPSLFTPAQDEAAYLFHPNQPGQATPFQPAGQQNAVAFQPFSQQQGFKFSPFGSTPNTAFSPFSPGNAGQYINDFGNFLANKGNPANAVGSAIGDAAGAISGSVSSLGGDWSGVDQWNTAIAAAAKQTGVDPNLIKAVMKLESNGDPGAAGSEGVWGPMQVNSNAWGDGPWMTDPTANILKGAEILKYYLDANGGNVREALRGYHGYGFDGNTTDSQYADIVLGNLDELKAGAGSGQTGSTGGGDLSSMFGSNASVPDWGGFNVPSDNGLYGYGTDYGMNGINHTGIDIPMPYGSAYYAPMGGTVVCAGTGNGGGEQGSGCAAFNDTQGGGAGRVEVLLSNGAYLIFGHSSRSALRVGDTFNAGDLLGYSGGENSDHVHLEARVVDPSTPSGFRIVDPRTVLGGGSFGGGGGGGNAGGGAGGGSGSTGGTLASGGSFSWGGW